MSGSNPNLPVLKRLSRNTVGTGRPLSKAKGNANIVGSLTKRIHALRGVETAIFAGGKITLLVCVHKTNLKMRYRPE